METPEEAATRKDRLDTQEKQAEIVRTLWRHENELANTRMTQFITMQALLFAGLGVTLQNSMREVVYLMCGLGIIVSFSTAVVFGMGVRAGTILNDWWKENLSEYTGPAITGNPIKVSDVKWWKWEKLKSRFTPVEFLPKAFFVSWLAIITYLLFHGPVMPEKIPKQRFEFVEALN